MYYSVENILEMASRAEGFTGFPKGYWLAPIRKNLTDQKSNEFNDVVNLMHHKTLVMQTTCTTVPGLPALKGGFRRYNNKGAAVVCSQIWMHGAFKYGLHAYRMKALRMIKAVWSTRDGNYDNKAEEYGKKTWGNVACNFHASTWSYKSKVVRFLIGHWSYGCIVCNNRQEYNEIIKLCKPQGSISMIILNEFSV